MRLPTGSGPVTVVDDISFSVDEGEIFAVIGPNGAGKTSLFNVISRVYRPARGTVRYLGGDLLNTRLNTLYAPSVRLNELAATVRPLLALWRDERTPGETFGDFCYRVGLAYLRDQVQAHASPV